MIYRPTRERPVLPAHFFPRPPPKPRPGDPALPYRLRYFAPPVPAASRAPCGFVFRQPCRWTNDPAEVTCIACIRSHLVQALLAEGSGPADFSDGALDSWGLRVKVTHAT